MKSLFAVLVTAFFVYSLVACDAADSNSPVVEDVHDTSVSTDTTAPEDSTVESDAEATEATQADALDESTAASLDAAEELEPEEKEQLPSDPTEDPDQEASYYEFPAWHIP